ncbi:macrophage immunometabolism regulator-like [Gymnogyps californianus]|uniref:macrophage immunometabolism regulator-like n=1 Tax=Gymnogyps californianus TaxID=33616 RepID=UPI0021C6E5C7|nr:macrophage immunometabolism regulator-like [Gymnogyps californianus]
MQVQGYDLVGITETWWDSSHDWSVAMEGYSIFRKDRPGRRGGGVALYVRDQLECMELCLGMDEETAERLWVRMKDKTGKGGIVMVACYRPPDQEEQADEALCRQLGAASRSQALVFMGDSNHPNICWRDNTTGHKQSMRYLKSIGDNFLIQVTKERPRRGALLDLILTNKEGLVGDVKVKGSLGCSDHEMENSTLLKMDINGESRSTISTLPVPLTEVSSAGKTEAEKPRCSSTPCSPMRRTFSGYQILRMDSNYLVGFTTGEELLKLAQKYTGNEVNKGDSRPNLHSKQFDSGLARSSRLYKTRSRYYQPYEIPAVNGRRRRRMPSSGDKCTKALPYEPYKALHGPLPLCLLKGKRAHSKSLDYLNLDKMSIEEPADTDMLQYQLQHLTLRGDHMFARNNT